MNENKFPPVFNSEELAQNELRKKDLIELVSSKRAVLMVGAGSSKFAGFPLLKELIDELGKQFDPSSSLPMDSDPIIYADQIKDKIRRDGRIKEYYKLLERTFQPKASGNHTDFHHTLVQLGFSGIITTNYDIVLETAISAAFTNGDKHWYCKPIDLCLGDKTYRVSDFLRSLSSNNNYNQVLHLHGCWDNPEKIILTEKDYLDAYGELRKDELGILDKIHRKVLWALLSMHSFLFVGFSMEDPFFMRMLTIVQQDFALEAEPIHYAIMPVTEEIEETRVHLKREELNEEIIKVREHLKRKGIEPLFYKVPRVKTTMEAPDHRGLEKLVYELANSLGVDVGSPGIVDVTRKMMER